MGRTLITERDIENAVRKGISSLSVDEGAIITPAARDAALKYRIEFVSHAGETTGAGVKSVNEHFPKDRRNPNAATRIAIGADHGGFQLKEMLRPFLNDLGYTVIDVGTDSEQTCDYPDFAFAVAKLVASNQASKGIMIDGVGVASAIVANKVAGIRAVPCTSEFAARSSREHNDANVLTLGSRVLGSEMAKSIITVWLGTWFGGGRHQQRVQKIQDIENHTMKDTTAA